MYGVCSDKDGFALGTSEIITIFNAFENYFGLEYVPQENLKGG